MISGCDLIQVVFIFNTVHTAFMATIVESVGVLWRRLSQRQASFGTSF